MQRVVVALDQLIERAQREYSGGISVRLIHAPLA